MNKRKAGKIVAMIAVGVMAMVGATTIAASVARPCDSLRLYVGSGDGRAIGDVVVGFSQHPDVNVREIWRGQIDDWRTAHIAIDTGDPLVVQGTIHLGWRDAHGTLRRETIRVRSEMVGLTMHAIIIGSALRDLRSDDTWVENYDNRGFARSWLTMGRT